MVLTSGVMGPSYDVLIVKKQYLVQSISFVVTVPRSNVLKVGSEVLRGPTPLSTVSEVRLSTNVFP